LANESLENYAYKIGNGIKVLRIRRGISAENICDVGGEDELCSTQTLSSIENGHLKKINMNILIAILKKLGTSLEEFTKEFLEEEYTLFDMKFKEIWNLIYDKLYIEAEEKLFELQKEKFYNKNYTSFNQSLLLCEGALLSRHRNKKDEALSLLVKSLQLTQPKIFDKKIKKVDLKKLAASFINKRESDILIEIAYLNTKKEALEIEELLYKLASSGNSMSVDDKNKVLSSLCFNMSNKMLDLGRKDKLILELCDEGINLEKQQRSTASISYFYYNKGRFYSLIGELENAQKFFQKSYDFFINIEKFDLAESVFLWSKEKYNIILTKGE